jgi:hypothetical protein
MDIADIRSAVPPKAKEKPTGRVPHGRLGVYAGKSLVGHVGPKATAVTAARFGAHRAKLGKDADGNDCWKGLTLAQCSARGATSAKISTGGQP